MGFDHWQIGLLAMPWKQAAHFDPFHGSRPGAYDCFQEGLMEIRQSKHSAEFVQILGIIQAGRAKAFEAVNVALIETYWAVGEQLSLRVAGADWGKGVVKELAAWLGTEAPELKGFRLRISGA